MIMGYASKDVVTYLGFSYSSVMKGPDHWGCSCQIFENTEEYEGHWKMYLQL